MPEQNTLTLVPERVLDILPSSDKPEPSASSDRPVPRETSEGTPRPENDEAAKLAEDDKAKAQEDAKKYYPDVAKRLNGSPYPTMDKQLYKTVSYKEDFNFSAIREIWDAREKKIYTIADEVMDKYLEDPRPWPSSPKQ